MVNQQIIYPYTDEQGKLLFRKARLMYEDGKKSFVYEHEENGKIVKGLGNARKVLFHLPLLLRGISSGMPIFLVEGEKDVETLLGHALIATTAPGTLEWNEEFTQVLKDANVVILYDNDETGVKRRDLLCKNLYGRVKNLRVVDLPGIEYRESKGQDITDWLQMGNSIEQLKDLLEQTPYYTPPQDDNCLRIITLDELFALELPEREILLEPFLPSQGLVLLAAQRGVGKTHIALGIAYAVASGGTFLNWNAPQAKKVLYVDGEMPLVLMQERLKMIESMNSRHPAKTNFKLLTPDRQNQPMPDFPQKPAAI